ncbi:MAG: hypothetical protein V1801_02615 [Candidatus Falkowbacteria bacterium]
MINFKNHFKTMKKYFKKIIILISLTALLALPCVVFASQSMDNLKEVGSGGGASAPYSSGTTEYTMSQIVGQIIQTFLGLLGVIFLVLIIYAGYNWMTAQGEEEKVTKAKDTLQRAVIGLIITIGAYAISYFVFSKLFTGTNIMTG